MNAWKVVILFIVSVTFWTTQVQSVVTLIGPRRRGSKKSGQHNVIPGLVKKSKTPPARKAVNDLIEIFKDPAKSKGKQNVLSERYFSLRIE